MERGRLISEFMMSQPEWNAYFDSLQLMKHKDLFTENEIDEQWQLQTRLGNLMTERYYQQLDGEDQVSIILRG
jgi:hypothetical protein